MKSSMFLSKLVHFETQILQSPSKCCVKFITHSNQYRATCGNALTLENVKSGCFSGVLFREGVSFFFGHRETHDFLQWQANQVSQGEQAALTKISEAEYRMKLLLEEQKPLSEARSEMNLQESRVESADRVLRESRPQVRSDIKTAPQPLGLSGSMARGHLMTKQEYEK